MDATPTFEIGDRVDWLKPKSDIVQGTVANVEFNKTDGEYRYQIALDEPIQDRTEISTWARFLREHQTPFPTPSPSITVGTQVRLIGVVIEPTQVGDPNVWVEVIGGFERNAAVFVGRQHVEVIRQPFKRGEVVYYVGDKDSEPLTVVTDEVEGFVLLARHVHGTETLEWDATTFERRP